MTTELANLQLLLLALAKVALLCGFVPAILILIFGNRIRAIGFEQVSERAVSHCTSLVLSDGNQPVREILGRAA